MRGALLLLALLLAPSAARAEDLCSDRPGLATDTCVLPAGVFQFESSLVDWSSTGAAGERTRQLTFGASMARVGIGRASEVQLSWTPWTRISSRVGAARSSIGGAGDAQLGFKTLLAAEPVAVAIAPFVKLPLAREPIGNGKIEMGVLVPFDLALAQDWSLTLTPELDWVADSDGGGRHIAPAAAASIAHSLSDSVSLALDVLLVRDLDPARHATSAAAGVSLAWQARRNLQLDVEAGTRLHGDVPDLTLIAGFVYRP